MKTPIVIILTFHAMVWMFKAGMYCKDEPEASLGCIFMALLNIAALIMVTV